MNTTTTTAITDDSNNIFHTSLSANSNVWLILAGLIVGMLIVCRLSDDDNNDDCDYDYREKNDNNVGDNTIMKSIESKILFQKKKKKKKSSGYYDDILLPLVTNDVENDDHNNDDDNLHPFLIQYIQYLDHMLIQYGIKSRSVHFQDDRSKIITIESRYEYTEDIHNSIWTSSEEIKKNRLRNAYEYYADGRNWRTVSEEDSMIKDPISGEYVHKVHSLGLTTYMKTRQKQLSKR